MEWVSISVFISSTFNDMHAERDLLLKKVFPELSEWCAKRRIRLFDIDLRWGVTSADSRSSNTVEVCLRNIDECRPFFLCFLGQRRGWIPQKDAVNEETLTSYPGIADRIGSRSVTEMEIEHALLSPMLRMVEGKRTTPDAAERSLFFIRDGSYLPALNEAQRKLFTNAATADEKQTDLEHAAFIARVRSEWNRVYDYTCRFDTSVYSHELREYGGECANGRLTDFAVGAQPLDRVILEALRQEIINAYPERKDEIPEEETETERQALRTDEIVRGTAERAETERILSSYCEQPDQRILYLHGKAGSGKTTMLCRFVQAHGTDYDRTSLHICGITPASSGWEGIWRQIETEFCIEHNDAEFDRSRIRETLQTIAEQGSTLIVIDGIDELSDGLACLSILPSVLPEGIRLIVSFRSDSDDAQALIRHLETREDVRIKEVQPLSGAEEISGLIHTYLRQYLKALDDEQIAMICENPASRNPLFLKILLREIRVFGSFDQLSRQIEAYGDTPHSAFGTMLGDLEQEISYTPVPASVFIPQLAGMLSRVRGTVPLTVLNEALHLLMDVGEEELSDTLSFYLRRLRPYLYYDGMRVGYSYRSLQESAAARYADFLISQHDALALAFREYDPLECLYHTRMAENDERLAELTEDLSFLIHGIGKSGAREILRELEACAADDPGSVSFSVLDCLQKTAALIGTDPQIAAALFYKELEREDLRDQAKALCTGSWLRYERVNLKVPQETESARFETLFAVEHSGAQGFSAAADRNALFVLKGERDISVCSLIDGSEHASFRLEGCGRIRKIAGSADGELLAAAEEDLTLHLYRITLDQDLNLLACSTVYTDQCSSVRFGGIALFASSEGIVWQRPDGTVVRYVKDAAEEETGTGKLTGCFDGGRIFKSASGYTIRLNGSGREITMSARVNDVLPAQNKVYAAAENRSLMAFDPETGALIEECPLPNESIGSLCAVGESVYGADRYGALIRLKNNTIEDLGRISQGDNILDTGTMLIPLENGRIAFVSMQRRAVLMTEPRALKPRLFRVTPTNNGVSLFWRQEKSFTVIPALGEGFQVPFPAYLLEGRNINETNNLKAVCSDHVLVYEENRAAVHFLNPAETGRVEEPGVPEMGGLLCSLAYAPETDTFRMTTFRSQYLETDESGNILVRLDLPRSDRSLSVLCICGKRSAVLSRRVHQKKDPSASAVIADMLTMIENDRILWSREVSRAEAQITGLLYDEITETLSLCYSTGRLELIRPETGELLNAAEGMPVSFLQGASLQDNCLWSVRETDGVSRLTVRSFVRDKECSLPSQRRVRDVIGSAQGILVMEGDEQLYRVSLENGKGPGKE